MASPARFNWTCRSPCNCVTAPPRLQAGIPNDAPTSSRAASYYMTGLGCAVWLWVTSNSRELCCSEISTLVNEMRISTFKI
jgi:hypothetical protein